jgi:hypothetical protein
MTRTAKAGQRDQRTTHHKHADDYEADLERVVEINDEDASALDCRNLDEKPTSAENG